MIVPIVLRGAVIAASCALLVACVPSGAAPGDEVSLASQSSEAPDFNGIPPQGFGPVTMVDIAGGTYPRATSFDSSQPDLVVPGGAYPVRRVGADRIRVGFTGMNVIGPDGRVETVPAPPSYTTAPSLRVGGTDDKLVAVIVARAHCGLPFPDAAELYAWGDEPVMRADDTGEFQFLFIC